MYFICRLLFLWIVASIDVKEMVFVKNETVYRIVGVNENVVWLYKPGHTYLYAEKKMRLSIAARCCPARIYVLQRTYRLHVQCNFERSSRICKWLLVKVHESFSFEFFIQYKKIICSFIFLYTRVERSPCFLYNVMLKFQF